MSSLSSIGPCHPNTFTNLHISPSNNDPASEIVSVTASLANVTEPPAAINAWPAASPATVEVCNLTVTYTHPVWHDTINAFIYLPASPGAWNGKLLGVGGGGWRAGSIADLGYAAAKGFAGAATDAGHALDILSTPDWAFEEDGESVNWGLLRNFAGVAVAEAGKLGRVAAAAFYGNEPSYSFFTGCSTGGRQGHMMAQRYPDLYDGILASAPAINWVKFLPGSHWPYVAMKEIGYYPPPCELDAITKAAISACDSVDGVEDTITVDDAACAFDPASIVGQEITCPDLGGKTIAISSEAATIAALIWDGPREFSPGSDIATRSGEKLWHGLGKTADLIRSAGTQCDVVTGQCKPVGFPIPEQWLRMFVSADKSLDVAALTWEPYTELVRKSVELYGDVMGTSDPDLSAFAGRGGKMLTWHGLTDQLITPLGTRDYFERVVEHSAVKGESKPEGKAYDSVAGFYRYFEAPGIEHCFGGEGWFPGGGLDALMNWVENDQEPETLDASNVWAKDRKPGSRKVKLCRYPKVLKYLGGDADLAGSWGCGENEDKEDSHWRQDTAAELRRSKDADYHNSRWRDEL